MPAPITQEQEVETFAAQEAIAAALQHYIDGARTGDGGLMRRAFADGARISGTYGGKAVEWTAQEFCEIIDKNGPAAELAARVVAIEYAGNAAMARLEAQNWRGTRYTDFLRVGQPGRWLADQQQGVFCPLARMKRIRAPAAVPPLRLGGACRARTRTMPVCPAL